MRLAQTCASVYLSWNEHELCHAMSTQLPEAPAEQPVLIRSPAFRDFEFISSTFARRSTYFSGDSTIPASVNQSALACGWHRHVPLSSRGDAFDMIYHKAEIQVIRHTHTEHRTRARALQHIPQFQIRDRSHRKLLER